jgi:putative Mn2+ efflux pump MntP
MDYIALIGIALGLSMDAFAVSITSGATIKKATPRFAIKVALSFGFFQGMMPVIGWLIGKAGESFINSVDHWIALILLSYLGTKMIIESKRNNKCETPLKKQDDLSLKTLLTLSIATSIDALATGIILPSAVGASTVALMLLSVGVITIVTFVVCMIGVYLGKNFGRLCSPIAEILGGAVLICIGLKIFIEHVFFN